MMSILSAWSAAIALPQVTSTTSRSTPSVSAIARPTETPSPLQAPDWGSLRYQGGAWVAPIRRLPRSLIASQVERSCAAAGGAGAATAVTKQTRNSSATGRNAHIIGRPPSVLFA